MKANSQGRQRPAVLSCRCTEFEAQLIRALAAKEDATVSDFLRTSALAGVSRLAEELQTTAGAI